MKVTTPASETLSKAEIERTKIMLKDAAERLSAARIHHINIVNFVPRQRRFIFSKKAHFVDIAKGWQLGVLLLSTSGELFAAGETTRAIVPGHPGHTSAERERRRAYTRIAFEAGYPVGEVLFFNSPHILLEADTPVTAPLTLENGELKVRWSRGSGHIAANVTNIPFAAYLAEQLALRLEFGVQD